ncbi:MAG: hypothetical protein IT378_27475, partial [Sandaracinaceae bacterium]|nr:hypothetical protein [Sandaracinaceae bacterium]
MSDISALVLHERREPEAAQIAAELERILDVHDEPEPSAAIALPVGDALAVGLDRADVVVALDAPSLARAREAGARVCVALCPYLGVVWDATLADADLVLVTHDALVDDAVDLGARRERVRVVGPIAPDGYAPPSDRASLRRELGLDPERPVVLVRATALDRIDQPVALVQLSLVAQQVQFLFDVGRDVDRAMSLRRTVPGYGIDAWIFAETDDAPRAWGAADLVLGTIGGPETARALA